MGLVDEIRNFMVRTRSKAWSYAFVAPNHATAAATALGELVSGVWEGNGVTPNPFFEAVSNRRFDVPDFYEFGPDNEALGSDLSLISSMVPFGSQTLRFTENSMDRNLLQLMSSQLIPVTQGHPLQLKTAVRVSNTTGSPSFRFVIEGFDEDKVSIGTAFTGSDTFTATTVQHKSEIFEPGALTRFLRAGVQLSGGALAQTLDVDHLFIRKQPIAFHAYSTTGQVIETGGGEQLGFDNEEFDHGNHFTRSANVNSIGAGESEFLAPYPMMILVGGAASLQANSVTIQLELCLNGSPIKFLVKENITGDNPSANGTVLVELDQGDSLQLRISHGSGGSQTTDGARDAIFFWGTEIVGYA